MAFGNHDRFRLKSGKFGYYFRDTYLDKDLGLSEALDIMNAKVMPVRELITIYVDKIDNTYIKISDGK